MAEIENLKTENERLALALETIETQFNEQLEDELKPLQQEVQELRAENERLKEKIETIEADTHRKSFLGGYKQGEADREGLREICRKAQRELAELLRDSAWVHGKLQACVTQLMDESTGDFIDCVLWADIDPLFNVQQDLKAVAETHDAKVREHAVRECINLVRVHTLGMDHDRVTRLINKLEALLPVMKQIRKEV